jgi:enoyl-CoA hydratase/carnithine racemase
MMITAALARSVPRKALLEMMLTGRTIDAEEAYRLGAVSRLVTRSELDAVVDDVVTRLQSLSPATLMLGRDAFEGVSGLGIDAALDRLQLGLTEVAMSDDAREGVVAFLEKRDPRWLGG